MAAHHYINNRKMFEEFVKHKEKTDEARRLGKRDPILPNYIGECFMLIANKVASRPNFSGYSYIDEMVSDGIENCIIAANNFDPNQEQKNPFGYFTKIIWWAFLRRIEKEKKQTYIKYKSMQDMAMMGDLFAGEAEEFKSMSINVDNEFMDAVVNNFESNKKKKDIKAAESRSKKKGVEALFADDEIDSIESESGDEIVEDTGMVLDAETKAALGYSKVAIRPGTNHSPVGRKKPSGAKHRG
jgi:hypothetical protein